MANEFQLESARVGVPNVYARQRRNSDGKIWNTNTSAYESLLVANAANYATVCAEQDAAHGGTGYYYGDAPVGSLSLGVFNIGFFQRVGGAPAFGDPLIGQQTLNWNGTADIGAEEVNVQQWNNTVVGALVAPPTNFTSLAIDANGYVRLQPAGTDSVLVAGQKLTDALRHIGATTAGKISGAGTGTETFQDFAGVTAVTVTVDANGNRTAISYG